MCAYLSSLPRPMTPDRTMAYSKVILETPMGLNPWERVAVVEAREIIAAVKASEPTITVEHYTYPYPQSESIVTGQHTHLDSGHGMASILAESLANFLTLEIH